MTDTSDADIQAAYEQGRLDEHARQREYVADTISSLLNQYADAEASFGKVARVSRDARIRADQIAMIAQCHALAAQMGRPKGYVWRGTERGDQITLTPDGDWPEQTQQAPRRRAA
jgi:hypothetical protein